MFLDDGITRGMQQPLDELVLQGQDVDTEGKDNLKLFCHRICQNLPLELKLPYSNLHNLAPLIQAQ